MNRNTDETAVQFPTTWSQTKGCGVGGDQPDQLCGDAYENSETGERGNNGVFQKWVQPNEKENRQQEQKGSPA